MKNKYFKNLITSLLITSSALMPVMTLVINTPTASAQSISGYVSGLAPAIVQLPLCNGKLNSKVSSLFNSVATTLHLNTAPKKLGDKTSDAASQEDSISTNDAAANRKLDDLRTQLTQVQASTASLDANDSCIKSIGRLVIKMLLQKITVSTIAWINSGFNGKPAFIQDPGKFFNDIAKNEILQFGIEINNPELFPFGKAWLQAQATAFNQKFTDNARYSLNDLIQQTTPQFSANSFQLDFSQGGWGAWDAMTQYPQNNPLGFQLMASDELQQRLQGTSQSVAQNTRDALQAANGFLGDYRCVDSSGNPTTVTQQDKNSALAAGQPDPCLLVGSWQYVTPGKLIADAATTAINYPTNNLLKAQDLNDAVAAILDALLSKFTSTVIEKGFASLGDEGADGSLIINQGGVQRDTTSQTEKDFTPVQLTSSWLGANPNFNIRTDLTQAIIDEQRTFVDKIKLQDKELNSTTDGKNYKIDPATGLSNAYGLIPAIDQLDYCIPGPHPGWEEDSQRTLDAVTNVIIPETEQSIANKTKGQIISGAQALAPLAGAAIGTSMAVAGATIGSVVPVVGTVIGAAVGALVGWSIGFIFGDDNGLKLRLYYAVQIRTLTGIYSDYPDNTSENVNALLSKQGAVQALNVMLQRYIEISHNVFNSKVLPDVTKEAATEFNKLQGYAQIIANNEAEISAMKNVVGSLTDIKAAIEALNKKYPNGGDAYENELKPQINAFGRLSASMVNGDDIANADNLLKQIMDEKDYVYKDLLKGPLGCEKDLETAKQNLPAQLYQTRRMDYPFPIIYNYNIAAGGAIPDPWNSGYTNHTNINATGALGPGFLSFYKFQVDSNAYTPCVADDSGVVAACELKVGDLVPYGNGSAMRARTRSLGTTKDDTNGPFEHTIGVY